MLLKLGKLNEQMIVAKYGRVEKYRKEELDNIFRWSEIFVCSLKESRVQESR